MNGGVVSPEENEMNQYEIDKLEKDKALVTQFISYSEVMDLLSSWVKPLRMELTDGGENSAFYDIDYVHKGGTTEARDDIYELLRSFLATLVYGKVAEPLPEGHGRDIVESYLKSIRYDALASGYLIDWLWKGRKAA